MENPVNKWRYIAGKILYKTPKICHGLLTFSNEQVLANRYLYYLLFAKEFTFNPTLGIVKAKPIVSKANYFSVKPMVI